MKTYWLLGRDDDPSTLPQCPFAQVLEQGRQKQQQQQQQSHDQQQAAEWADRAASRDTPQRSLYSPVSFQDVNVRRMSLVGATPQSSPTHAAGGEGRRGSKGSSHHVQADGQGGVPPGGLGVSKPTQAVPPTRSGSSSPTGHTQPSPPEVMSSDRQLLQRQENGVQHAPQQSNVHSNRTNTSTNTNTNTNASSSSVTNNNDKSRLIYSISASDRQEPCSPVKRHAGDNGRAPPAGSGSSSGPGGPTGSDVIKSPPVQPGGLAGSPDGRMKDSRSEKPKSKTCIVL